MRRSQNFIGRRLLYGVKRNGTIRRSQADVQNQLDRQLGLCKTTYRSYSRERPLRPELLPTGIQQQQQQQWTVRQPEGAGVALPNMMALSAGARGWKTSLD